MDTKTKESKDNYDKKAWEYEKTSDGKYTLPFNRYLYKHVPLKDHDRILNPEAFLKEAHRILKPQGKIYIADPTAPGIIRHIENFYFPLLKTDGYKMFVEGCRT